MVLMPWHSPGAVTTAPSNSSAEELVSRADEICVEGAERFAEIQSEPAGNAGRDRTRRPTELFDVASDELSDLRELRPPDDLREPYDAYLQARGAALVELLEQGRDAAAAKDGEAYVTAQDKANAGQAGAEQARAGGRFEKSAASRAAEPAS